MMKRPMKPAAVDEAIQEIDPGTPDERVGIKRLRGRVDYREGVQQPSEWMPKNDRVQWWEGWYDERLRRFYGR